MSHECRFCGDKVCDCLQGYYACVGCKCCERYNEEGDDPESDGDEFDFDCGMDRQGNCGKAGSEECDWECPYRNAKRN